MIQWTTELRKIKGLKPHPKNPRILTKDQHRHLKTSVEKFGLADKPIINTDGTIIGGHQRLKILKELGHKEIEVLVPNRELTQEEVDEFCIRLNKNTGEWDFDILANEWEVNDLIDWGFTEQDLTGLLDAEEKDEGTEDESEQLEPVADENARTVVGDRYTLNDHVLVCGDSTNREFVSLCLGEARPLLILTDPPYNLASENNLLAKDCSKSMKNLSNSSWDKNFEPHKFLEGLINVMPADCSVYIFTSHHLAGQIWDWMKLWSDHYSWCVWCKANPMPSLMKRHWTWNTELVCYATRGKHIFNFPIEGHALCSWDIHKENPTENHPTQKPIDLMSHIIKHSSDKGSIIFDAFLGSGTTLIAAEQLGRTCYGLELSPGYCDIIVDRWVNFMKKNNREYIVKKNGEVIDG